MPGKEPIEVLLTREFVIDDYLAKKKLRAKAEPAPPRVITISRDYGALGEEIAAGLGQRLGLPVYGTEILEQVAKRARIDKFFLEHFDEQGSAKTTTFLYSLITGSTATLLSYRRYLYDVVLELAQKDCILIGRGAHLILQDRPVFRLRIVGSRLNCAARISGETGIGLTEAEQKVAEINGKRHQSIVNLFGENFEHCSLEHAANFDLILNTDRLSVDGAVAITLLAVHETESYFSHPKASS
ncbi:AAA family ATPase [Methylococcus sp. EFPC2]|uniref:cytidylate kinase-like family protein n=1 Tax=Methylococcus sp. EFPC2 TaxID=2812648 RepID=UPI001967B0D3|nr:cytidylate kinase-like family protein [Methylococcus sp. EFPC2]QSA96754.1 cytidylate kinase-like family protein [Methylococcus sp. EFPC2]